MVEMGKLPRSKSLPTNGKIALIVTPPKRTLHGNILHRNWPLEAQN